MDDHDMAVIDAFCSATGRCRTEVVREILGVWTDKKRHEAMLIMRVSGRNPVRSESDSGVTGRDRSMTGVAATKPATQALASIEQACADLMITVNQQVDNCGMAGELEALNLVVRAISNLQDRVEFKQKHGQTTT